MNFVDVIRIVATVLSLLFLTSAVVILIYVYGYRKKLRQLAFLAKQYSEGVRDINFTVEGPAEIQNISRALFNMSKMIDSALADLKNEEHRQIQFVSDVSHEIRTPLTAIRGAAETLLDGDVDKEHQERFLTTIGAEAERLTRLANDLLALQRIEGATGELPTKRIDLNDLAHTVANMMEPLLDARGVELTITGDAPPVLGDVDRLHQVLFNLIDNASRFVGEGGTVRVVLTEIDDKAVISVIDNGPGLKVEDVSRLFDRFYRADASRSRTAGGTGLGLSIVRAIVAAHNGEVSAQNSSDGGACFTVKLPALRSSADPTKKDPFAPPK